jgi:hypothetical protein
MEGPPVVHPLLSELLSFCWTRHFPFLRKDLVKFGFALQ